MFDKRLLALVDGSGRMIAAIVGLKWPALVANIVVFVSLGLFIQQALAQTYVIPSAASDALTGLGLSDQALLLLCAVSIAVRVATSVAAQRVSAEVSGKAKKLIRGKVYDKLVKMGPFVHGAHCEQPGRADRRRRSRTARGVFRLVPPAVFLYASYAVRFPRAFRAAG